MENKISVVINTYNAEKYLRRVLESVKDFDEIVICDMESTDSTVRIADEFGCRIVTFPKGKCNIVEPARDFAIHQARFPWVLVVDADELVTTELKTYLYEEIKKQNPPAGFLIPRKNFFMGKFMHGKYPNHQLRFFQRDRATWPPVIHTKVHIEGKLKKIAGCHHDLALIHLENDSISAMVEKINRYTTQEISKRAHKKYGLSSLLWRPFYGFFDMYIKHGGFLDGNLGYLYAKLETMYQLVMLAKIEEATKHDENNN